MWAWLLEQLSGAAREPTAEAGEAAWETTTRYVRGILAVAAIDAVGIGIALAVIGVPLAPLALLVFVGSFVPYVGSTISGVVAVLVALAANGPVDALVALAAVVAVQQIEGNLLEPFIVGRQVRLHPQRTRPRSHDSADHRADARQRGHQGPAPWPRRMLVAAAFPWWTPPGNTSSWSSP